MTDGYTVEEAASVLGVPAARVWELVARGVLSGTREGGDVRVFLQQRPNGNGGRDAGEASPFRELLTEFRNLTERYGQALLALGEARGEVASLRSRVDLLEARVELRLPGSAAPALAWHGSDAPAVLPHEPGPAPSVEVSGAAVENATDAAAAPDMSPVDDAARRPRERRRGKRGAHPASDEIADALARADDPSVAVLPAAERAQPSSAPDRGGPAAREVAEAALPLEAAVAETLLIADELPRPRPRSAQLPRPATPAGTSPHELGVAVEALALSVSPPAVEVTGATDDGPEAAPHVEPLDSSVSARADDDGEHSSPSVSFEPVEPLAAASEGEWSDDWGLTDDEAADEVAAAGATPADEAPPPLPAYEPLPPDAPYTTVVGEPDWFSEADLVWSGPTDEPRPADASRGGSAPAGGVRRLANVELPGSGDLRDALAALDALRPAAADATSERSPAGRAYQRLRRLFPG